MLPHTPHLLAALDFLPMFILYFIFLTFGIAQLFYFTVTTADNTLAVKLLSKRLKTRNEFASENKFSPVNSI